jgi:hypothetical protein
MWRSFPSSDVRPVRALQPQAPCGGSVQFGFDEVRIPAVAKVRPADLTETSKLDLTEASKLLIRDNRELIRRYQAGTGN